MIETIDNALFNDYIGTIIVHLNSVNDVYESNHKYNILLNAIKFGEKIVKYRLTLTQINDLAIYLITPVLKYIELLNLEGTAEHITRHLFDRIDNITNNLNVAEEKSSAIKKLPEYINRANQINSSMSNTSREMTEQYKCK